MTVRPGPGLALAALMLPVPAFGQAYQCNLPRQIENLRAVEPEAPARPKPVGWYTLAASWSPEYCKMNGDRSSMQCSGRNGHFGFVLHGLWPEARSGPPPQWCSTTPRPSPELIRRNLCMTPVPWLIEHEWAKHGSCMTKRPETYLKVSGILWHSLKWPDADYLSRKKDLTAGDLRQAFLFLNPDWRAEHVGIETSRTGWLRGMRLCYGLDFMPRRCPRATFGPPDNAPLKIWRGL